MLCVGALLAGCTSSDNDETPPEQKVAEAFLSALANGDALKASQQTTDPAAAAPIITAFYDALRQGDEAAKVDATLTVSELSGRSTDAATAQVAASWRLAGVAQPWAYSTSLPMVRAAASGENDKTWKVTWSSTVLHPQLAAGTSIAVVRAQAPRAALLDSAGQPLFTDTPVVTVGVVPNQVTDPAGEAAVLAANLGISAEDIVKDITDALPARGDHFIEVVTVRRTAYEAVRAAIYELPGVQFREGTKVLAPSATFARQLLGTVGPATADQIADSKGRLGPGDDTGFGGLQQALDAQLAGTAGLQIQLVKADGTSGGTLSNVAAPVAGTPAQLTIDRTVQSAADGALAALAQQASIVVVQPSSGKVLAAANSAAAAENIALVGQYPPGSTFKVVTATAAMGANPALTPSSPMACPGTITVDGRQFENQDKFDLGPVDFRTAFARSCNTSFIAMAGPLPATALPSAAAAYGIGADWKLPVDSFSGSVPAPVSATEQAADAIGQGKVLMSPLAMATVAATAQSGRPVPPSLVVGSQGTPGPALPPATVAALQEMMRAVVTSGTAANLAGLPGEVFGKTGTAEYGTDTPPRAHSWFIGFRGDLAFAVFVADGSTAGVVASEVAKTFLAALPA